MNEKEFVDKLKETPFSRGQYASIGVSEQFINRTIEGYNPKLKTSLHRDDTDDPLVRLVNNYDVTKTEIGMVCFESEVDESDDYYFVGKFEADFLCISKFSKEVVILAFDDPLTEMYKCAQNSSRFFEAIIVAAKFLEKAGLDQVLRDSQPTICSMAENCSEIAGGRKYLDFYKVLLGCES